MNYLERISEILQYLLLGFVQGFTEPIPVSSSGHLIIIQDVLGLKTTDLSFEILLHFASLIAIVMIYWDDIARLAMNGYKFIVRKDQTKKDEFQFIIYLIVATIPAGILGVLFEDQIGELFSTAKMVGISLIITGFALWIIRNLRGRKSDGDLTLKDAIIIGLAQAVALIPGISRSGATLVAAMLLGMKQETALRFSFLLFIPVSLGSFILSLDSILSDQFLSQWPVYLIAFITAGIATYYALRWFMNIMEKGNLIYFSIYCFIAGLVAIIIL